MKGIDLFGKFENELKKLNLVRNTEMSTIYMMKILMSFLVLIKQFVVN